MFVIDDLARMPKQPRTLLACDTCRRRKIRCDSVRPQCGNCCASGSVCTYIPTEHQSTVGTRFALITRRLERIERNLLALQPLADPKRLALIDQLLDGAKDMTAPSDLSTSTLSQSVCNEQCTRTTNIFKSLPLFNDRLEQLKAHTCGNEESSNVYTSSVFLSVFSSADIELLSRRLNDSVLPQRFEDASNRMWRMNQRIIGRLIERPACPTTFDKRLILYIQRSIHASNEGILYCLLQPVDFDNIDSLPDFIQNGIFAALIILASLEVQLTGNFSLFPRSLIQSQKELALRSALKTLGHIRFSMPQFISVRVSTLLLWLLSVASTVPATFQFVEPTITMAKAIGIDQSQLNKQHPEPDASRRTEVWNLLVHFHYILVSSLSKKPILAPDSVIPTFGQNNDSKNPQIYLLGIEKIYYKARYRLFSIPCKSYPRDVVLNDILCLADEVMAWRSGLPTELWDDKRIHPSSCDLGTWMFYAIVRCMKSMHDHTLLIIYSIPAFSPNYLPQSVASSLEIVTHCARDLLRTAVYAQKSKNAWTLIPSACVTAAIGTMLYKQIRYPYSESNRFDIEHLQNCMSSFINCQDWPMIDNAIPLKLLWQVLLDLLIRLYNTEVEDEYQREIPHNLGDILNEGSLNDLDKEIFEMPLSELHDDCVVI